MINNYINNFEDVMLNFLFYGFKYTLLLLVIILIFSLIFLIIGCKIADKYFIISVFEAISIIPLHKHVAPNKVNVNFTAFSADSKIQLFIFSIFPDKIA